jgi:hypothetical protein
MSSFLQRALLLLIYLVLFILELLWVKAAKQQNGPYVYVISIGTQFLNFKLRDFWSELHSIFYLDGMRTDYLWKRDTLGLRIPTLRSLVRGGVLAQGALSVMPAVTYPSHTR